MFVTLPFCFYQVELTILQRKLFYLRKGRKHFKREKGATQCWRCYKSISRTILYLEPPGGHFKNRELFPESSEGYSRRSSYFRRGPDSMPNLRRLRGVSTRCHFSCNHKQVCIPGAQERPGLRHRASRRRRRRARPRTYRLVDPCRSRRFLLLWFRERLKSSLGGVYGSSCGGKSSTLSGRRHATLI